MSSTPSSSGRSPAGGVNTVLPYRMHVSQRYLDLTRQKLELTRLPRDPQVRQQQWVSIRVPRFTFETGEDFIKSSRHILTTCRTTALQKRSSSLWSTTGWRNIIGGHKRHSTTTHCLNTDSPYMDVDYISCIAGRCHLLQSQYCSSTDGLKALSLYRT